MNTNFWHRATDLHLTNNHNSATFRDMSKSSGVNTKIKLLRLLPRAKQQLKFLPKVDTMSHFSLPHGVAQTCDLICKALEQTQNLILISLKRTNEKM